MSTPSRGRPRNQAVAGTGRAAVQAEVDTPDRATSELDKVWVANPDASFPAPPKYVTSAGVLRSGVWRDDRGVFVVFRLGGRRATAREAQTLSPEDPQPCGPVQDV